MSSEDCIHPTTSRADIDATMVRYLPMLRRQVRRRAGSLHYGHFDLEDVVQHAFESAIKHCRRYRDGTGTIDGWVVMQFSFAARNATAEVVGSRSRTNARRTADDASRWLQERGRQSNGSAVEAFLGWEPGRVSRLVKPQTLSLDHGTCSEDIGWLHEQISDDSELPDDALDRETAHQAIIDATTNLRDALVVHYILDGETNAEVGRWFGLSKERVRQIYARTTGRAVQTLTPRSEVSP